MFDSSKLISEFHANHVRLSNTQRSEMRARREANVSRIKSGLSENDKAEIVDVINQGGYAMKTMTQPPEGSDFRYDIDLGLVFEEEDAATPRATRGWVLDALAKKATNVKGEPEDTGKCIRIEYAEGYQCDFPVFKRGWNGDNYLHYIALRNEWTISVPSQINDWFERQVRDRSPESSAPYQLRQLVRLIKFIAKTWSFATGSRYPSGLLLTALAVEQFKPHIGRIDESLYQTLRSLGLRNSGLPVYADGILISSDNDADRIERFRAKAEELADRLQPLETEPHSHDDDSSRALWKRVFRHSFFDSVEKKPTAKNEEASAGGSWGGLSAAIITERASAAVKETKEPTVPWGC